MKQQKKVKQLEVGEIPDNWKTFTIGEIAEVIGGGTPSTDISGYWNGDISWITPKDLSNFKQRYIKRGERNITKHGLENSSAKLLPKNTVLLTTRAPIGYLAIAENEVTTNQGFRSLIHNEKTTSDFLFYLLKNNINVLKGHSSGTTFGELSGSVLKSLKFNFPSLPEQKAIAKIISDLDAKTELNNQMNKLLGAIGQTLFNHWFVTNKEIPKGWETKSLDEIAEFLNGLALQKYPAQDGEEFLPVIKIRELKNGISSQTDKASFDLPDKYVIKDGDILFSWSGSLEVVVWTGGEGALNQHLFKVSSEKYPKWFYYYWVKEFLPDFKKIAEGKATTMGHIQRHHLSQSKVLVPDTECLNKMNKVMSPLLEKIILLGIQSKILSNIRDQLLPQLMSGKIRVPLKNG